MKNGIFGQFNKKNRKNHSSISIDIVSEYLYANFDLNSLKSSNL